MDTILAKAKAELAVIDRQIARLHEKQARLQNFVQMYGELAGTPISEAVSAPPEQSGPSFADHARAVMREVASGVTIKSRIAGAVSLILADGIPRHTRVLVPLLESQGIPITGKDKFQAVSAILSTDDRFKADRSVGWSLDEEAAPAGTGAASFGSTSGVEPDRTPSGN